MNKQSVLFAFAVMMFASCTMAQPLHQKKGFDRQDTLRGSLSPERTWWDVAHYNIDVTPDFATRSIKGSNEIAFKVLSPGKNRIMQIDLREPMQIDSVTSRHFTVKKITREKNVYWLDLGETEFAKNENLHYIKIFFSGVPVRAMRPPWDGGWIWTKDRLGRPWMSVACQGLGASVWYPCKDHQSDEPDKGAILSMNVPDTLVAIGNGRLKSRSSKNGMANFIWEVTKPINNYNIIPYIGKYANWTDTLRGEKGILDLSYWVIDNNVDKAKKQFEQVKPTLRSFEYWMGPYPFYEDSYKLIEAPHLGMEHQSAVAYGNQFKNGYLGSDLSGTGHGLKWDYIIVHETGHEWFGNNITTKDVADMWVQEGFTDYSETLFTESYWGKKASEEYVQGLRKNIQNDMPIIGPYGVNQEGSGDMYYKGANLIHTIRHVINDDKKFREILRGLGKDFYVQTVTTKQIEDYISRKSGIDFSKVFDQYLRTKDIPLLEMKTNKGILEYRWSNAVDGFNMRVKLNNGQWISPTTEWQKVKLQGDVKKVKVDGNFYVRS